MYHKALRIFIHMHVKRSLFVGMLAVFFCISQGFAQHEHEPYQGHKITGTITNYDGKMAVLAMLYGGNNYVVDTATIENGSFTFESKYILQAGVYVVVLPPSKSFLILIDEKVPVFSFSTDMKDIDSTIRFAGAPDNTAYYEYLKFFQVKRTELDRIKSEYEAQKSDNARQELLAKMQRLKNDILKYQTDLVARIPGTLTAAMVKCELPVEAPAFDGAPEQMQMKKFMFQKAHYFDNIDLDDERLIRAPKNVLVDRVHYYLENLTAPTPDSIIASVDYILDNTENNEIAYRFLLTYVFNKYRESKKIGMDAVYVHIAENYIAKGKAPWIEEQEKNLVLDAVKLVSPTLIGKKAPNFTVQLEDKKDISLYSIQSPYTVLVFWSPNCPHCKESMPLLSNFYKTHKDKGIEIFAVCTKLNEQEKSCWDYVDKNLYTNWINASDQTGGTSSVQTIYNVKTTPKIYVLDKDKKILVKDLGVENLEEVFKQLLERK